MAPRPFSEIVSSVRMVVGGEVLPLKETFEVLNPATEEVLGLCPNCTKDDVDQAVAAAKGAAKSWAATPLEERRRCLAAAQKLVIENKDALSELLCKEQGKPKGGESSERQYVGASGELAMSIGLMAQCLQLEPEVKVHGETKTHRIEIHRRPVGVVAGITPWNFPLAMCVSKLAPAVVLGNTFISKPSPFTPLTTLAFVELIKDCFPPGVINCVISSDQDGFSAGAHLTRHPDIRKVSFTGSEKTGKLIFAACSHDVKRVTLEMGGNDAAIVRKDVDIKEVTKAVFQAAFLNSGQVCIAIKRLFVHEDIYDEFVSELATLAKEAKVGNGMDPTTMYGPLCNSMQLKKVEHYVEDAKKNGANIVYGGSRMPGKGFFYTPTIVKDVKEGLALVDEEQFGPVLPVIKFKDDDEVVQRANSIEYGLGGSVWSADVEKANEMAAQIEAGMVWVNEHLGDMQGAPFGGFKQSGLGRERGSCDIDSLTEIQTLKVALKKE